MVYYTQTLELCHMPTKIGEKNYRKFLEHEADKILFKHMHPIKWVIMTIKDSFVETFSKN